MGGVRTAGHPETERCRPKWILGGFRWILTWFLGGLGVFRELCFQTWRTPRPPERRKKCTKRGFRGTMDACESFVRNTPCPEGWFCDENIVNNKVLARGQLSPIWSQIGSQTDSKMRLGRPFWCPGAVRKATGAATERFGRWLGTPWEPDLIS